MARLIIGNKKDKYVIFDDKEAMNSHIVVIGKSGSGKSVACQKLCLQLASAGETVVALDLHGTLDDAEIFPPIASEFIRCCNSVDAYEEGISIPLFTPVAFDDGRVENDIDTVGAITDVFARTYNLHCNQRACLRTAVKAVFRQEAYCQDGISALNEELMKQTSEVAKNVRDKLTMILEHNVFRDGALFIEPGKINIIRLGHFDLNTQVAIAEVLLSYIWRLAVAGGFKERGVHLFVDECQSLSFAKDKALSMCLTEGRKLNVSTMLATQFLVNSSVEAQRILQSGLIMYFQPTRNKIRETAKIIDPAQAEEWASDLSNLEIGEFVAVGPMIVDGKKTNGPLLVSGR